MTIDQSIFEDMSEWRNTVVISIGNEHLELHVSDLNVLIDAAEVVSKENNEAIQLHAVVENLRKFQLFVKLTQERKDNDNKVKPA